MELLTWNGRALAKAAFFDAPVLLTSLNVVKDFVLAGDAQKSVFFLRYQARAAPPPRRPPLLRLAAVCCPPRPRAVSVAAPPLNARRLFASMPPRLDAAAAAGALRLRARAPPLSLF